MFLIPGFLISAITFPGVIIHEFAHLLFCRWRHVAVFKVCYFRFGNPAGYVMHEPSENTLSQVLISVGPFFINSILGVIIATPGASAVMNFDSKNRFDQFLMWLGLSIAMHAFPSKGDAQSMWEHVKHQRLFTRLLVMPIMGLIYIGSFGSIIWLDLFYGLAIGIFIPQFILSHLA